MQLLLTRYPKSLARFLKLLLYVAVFTVLITYLAQVKDFLVQADRDLLAKLHFLEEGTVQIASFDHFQPKQHQIFYVETSSKAYLRGRQC